MKVFYKKRTNLQMDNVLQVCPLQFLTRALPHILKTEI